MMFRLFSIPLTAPPWAARCDRAGCLNAIKLRPGPRAKAIAEARARGWLVGGRGWCVACPLCAELIARGHTSGFTTQYDLTGAYWADEPNAGPRLGRLRYRGRVILNINIALEVAVDGEYPTFTTNAHHTATARATTAAHPATHRRGV